MYYSMLRLNSHQDIFEHERNKKNSTDTDDKQSGSHLSLNYLPLRHILNMSKSDSHLGTGNAPFICFFSQSVIE